VAYRIATLARVEKELAGLPRDAKRLSDRIGKLADDPRPRGCLPVRAAPHGTYRVRVGDYRVIYVVLDTEKLVIVTRVRRKGKDTYQGL